MLLIFTYFICYVPFPFDRPICRWHVRRTFRWFNKKMREA